MRSLRSVYDAIEKQLTPHVESTVRSDEFRTAAALANRVRREVGTRIEDLGAGVLHLVNLPAGSDIRKLRRQIGELDFNVRQLRLELEAELARTRQEIRDGADS
ncbi:hypothetical protein [Nocardia lasii]|uniref:Uncharacterized protein n=1 Tax=Nocardia lasii TaxID=1616107 RepID=A0ABW1JP07_9NOCA